MPRPRSVVARMTITVAARAHGCRYNKGHRLAKGMRRLTVRADGADHHYCLPCAAMFLTRGVSRLQALLDEVRGGTT